MLQESALVRESAVHAVNPAILVGHINTTQLAESKADKFCEIDITKEPDMPTNQVDPDI